MIAALAFFALAPFGHDHYITRDAGWCWFADPRAIWMDGKIVAGAVTKNGDVTVTEYNPKSTSSRTTILAPSFEKDDHDNPSLLVLPDHRIAAFYSKHSGSELFLRMSLRPSDVSLWTDPVAISPNDPSYKGPAGALNAYCYPNPQMLAGEKDRIYLFWRGMNWKPTLSWSNDLGKTWSKGRIVVSPKGDSPSNRPYVKVAGNGKDRIHLAFTDGHPRNEATNSIYYARYEAGAFRRTTGREIAKLSKLPFRPDQADVIYDGKAEGVRAWIWDIAEDSRGNPIIVYVRLPKETEHQYRYARWDGFRWVDRPIVSGGKWFPQTPEGQGEREPHYSGGLCLDPADPRFVYLSRPIEGRFEIERWFTPDNGDHWSHVGLTGGSKHDSVRPFVVRGLRGTDGPIATFLNMNRYVHYTDYTGTLQASKEDRGPWTGKDARHAADAVWRWVRSNPSSYTRTEWMLAPLYSGVLDYAEMASDPQAEDWVRQIGASLQWKLGPRPMMADDQAVGQAYLDLFAKDKNPDQIAAIKLWADASKRLDHAESLEWKNSVHNREWAWCDALFMAPPVLAKLAQTTSDRSYLELCSRLWWKTSDYLYDGKEDLFFRDSRYFKPREANGKKVFWSRGNGWVLAGLARVLAATPPGDPLRNPWEKQFVAMATRLASLQTADGTWHASLLNPAAYPAPETSGTGFYCYAMAWGIREGLLDRARFEPVVRRAFEALCRSVDPSGRLGWVQPIGQDPRNVSEFDTDAYGVGAFLLAAAQVARL